MILTKTLLICVGSFMLSSSFSQVDSNALKKIYDRVLDFDESKTDSISWYADYIEQESARLKFAKGKLLGSRLRGIHAEYGGEYESAIQYYLVSLDESRRLKMDEYESSALSDLAILYSTIKNPEKAREYYLQATKIALRRGEVSSVVTHLSNLGAVYNQMKQADSALVFLNEALRRAAPHEKELNLSSLYNNIGTAWFHKGEWAKALSYFRKNYEASLLNNDRNMLWYDVLNISDAYVEMNSFDSAFKYLQHALELARELSSRSKEADVYQMFSKYYARKGEYRSAFEHLQQWHNIDTSLINLERQKTIAELQERFNVKQREQENKLLFLEIDRQKLQNRNITIAAVGTGLLALGVGFFLMLIRRKNRKLQVQNELIQKQNQKLAELNSEKNSLISVVSHDLSSPFTSIKMWNHILQSSGNDLSVEQQKAVQRIQSSAENGERLIRNILDIEKAETNLRQINLENFDLRIYLEEVISSYRMMAQDKKINLHYAFNDKDIFILTDKHLVGRICENLLSNAIKYTTPGKNVYVSVSQEKDAVHIHFKDEGVGIEKDELRNLFSKYSKISSKPTAGEDSTGLGLSIVKRIVDELNGKIFFESEAGKGSLFTVVLKK